MGYWITCDGIQPVKKKVDAIQKIAAPSTKKELRRFIGMVNYYRDMWARRSDILAPLTALTSKEAKWQWTDVEQQAFDRMKRLIGRSALLAYPNFNKTFVIHTDASHTQLGAVISQDNKPIAFYSRKLNPAQTRYTTTERELLSIVETLKEFRNILLGQQITVYTDHRNLTFKHFNTERVMRWRLIVEEFNPKLVYIKGDRNVVADALSRLDYDDSLDANLEDSFAIQDDKIPQDIYPLSFSMIAKYQASDDALQAKLRRRRGYHLKPFRGGGSVRNLICFDHTAYTRTTARNHTRTDDNTLYNFYFLHATSR